MRRSKRVQGRAQAISASTDGGEQLNVAAVFQIMAAASLLPKPAWELNRELRRGVRLAVQVNYTTGMPRGVLRSVLATKAVKGLTVHNAGHHDLADCILTAELQSDDDMLPAMLDHLQSFTVTSLRKDQWDDLAEVLESLPDSVRRVSISGDYPERSFGINHPCRFIDMQHVPLPPRCEKLELSSIHQLRCQFPASLTSVSLVNCCLTAVPQLPESATSVRLGIHFAYNVPQPIAFTLPDGLRDLHLGDWSPQWAIESWPPALKSLKVHYRDTDPALPAHPLAPLPHALETLVATAPCTSGQLPILAGKLPPRLRTLDLEGCCKFKSALGPLPPNLKSLRLPPWFERDLGPLPESLTALHVRREIFGASAVFDRPLGALPPSLRVLDLEGAALFNHPLGRLPRALRELRLGDSYSRHLAALPPALEVLTLGRAFDGELQPQVLPRSRPC
eukprot:TRINITY_DN3831_c0_g1_i1.p1 TRINITY_DN3831_c0_g1~~TRINITY_DN3831_c0_g1_i1.p1  ORF type:complete len:449 (-),score=84.06 TRINITY_DN3831_c0_g1_i1:223-1569(-)